MLKSICTLWIYTGIVLLFRWLPKKGLLIRKIVQRSLVIWDIIYYPTSDQIELFIIY
jgi:hypothetical protein